MKASAEKKKKTPKLASRHRPTRLGVLSFFTGAMGLDLGLEEAGLKVILTSEIDKCCIETIKANRPTLPIIGDIRDYSAKEIVEAAGIKSSHDVDVIVGGPPCQAFSTAGHRRGFEDERGNVFLKFINIILDIRPKYAVIENVRGLLSAPLSHRPHTRRGFGYPPLTPDEEKGGALHHILTLLEDGGYFYSFNLYNSANFGSPQIRERIIIVCSRDKGRVPYLSPTHSEHGEYGLPVWRTFKEATDNLPDCPKDFIRFSEKRLNFYRMLKPGENWRNLPKELQKEAMGNSYFAGGGKTGFYRRLAWDKPSPTLVTHPAMPATDLAHPVEDRPLSVQEYKRIQEFPDEWIISGKIVDQYRQIGNAVPCSLGKAVGMTLLAHSEGIELPNYPDFPYSRYKGNSDIEWLPAFKRSQTHSSQIPLFVDSASEKT